MTTKHTPGPWYCGEPFEVFPGAGLRFHVSQAEGATYTPHYSDVAHFLAETIPGEKLEIQRANARLIAAAPELLEALEKRLQADAAYAQLALADVDPNTHEHLLQQIEDAEEAAKDAGRAAIAKARGAQ